MNAVNERERFSSPIFFKKAILPANLSGKEECVGVLVVVRNEYGRADVQRLRVHQLQVLRTVDHDLPLRLPREAGDDEELPTQHPDHASPLLGHDLATLQDWPCVADIVGCECEEVIILYKRNEPVCDLLPGVENPDLSVPAERGQEAAALAELGGKKLVGVALK